MHFKTWFSQTELILLSLCMDICPCTASENQAFKKTTLSSRRVLAALSGLNMIYLPLKRS